MGGSKYYGVVTADALKQAKYGGASYVQKDALTIDAVSTALRRTVNNDPTFASSASTQTVARRVEKDLEDNGFNDIKSVKGTVSDGKAKYGFSKRGGLWVAVKKNKRS